MRNLTKLTIGLALSSVMAFSASAEIINSDWLIEGDGRAFTDTGTGLEYLDLNETLNMSITQVKNLLDTTYAGWSFATGDQVATTLTNLLTGTGVQYSEAKGQTVHDSAINSRFSILQVTGGHYTDNNNFYIYGFVRGDFTSLYGIHLPNTYSRTFNSYGYGGMYTEASSATISGVWLVRDNSLTDVPAPLALSSLALLGLGLTRRKKIA